jgi:alkylhydroperoxidase/carboxymuconolactone decarboxylase family protein YurZ
VSPGVRNPLDVALDAGVSAEEIVEAVAVA